VAHWVAGAIAKLKKETYKRIDPQFEESASVTRVPIFFARAQGWGSGKLVLRQLVDAADRPVHHRGHDGDRQHDCGAKEEAIVE
jgi:hypothetical protein